MRRFFTDEFNGCTRFVKRKRYKKVNFYDESLELYINKKLLPVLKKLKINTKDQHFLREIKITLAAFIYPKDLDTMADLKDSERLKLKYVKQVLYSFSMQKLSEIADELKSLHFLFRVFTHSEKDHLLANSPTFTSKKLQFVEGFDFLENLFS